jgi:hypothetical protein
VKDGCSAMMVEMGIDDVVGKSDASLDELTAASFALMRCARPPNIQHLTNFVHGITTTTTSIMTSYPPHYYHERYVMSSSS